LGGENVLNYGFVWSWGCEDGRFERRAEAPLGRMSSSGNGLNCLFMALAGKVCALRPAGRQKMGITGFFAQRRGPQSAPNQM
jgi:hypothetical protein